MFGRLSRLEMFCAHTNPLMTIVATTGGNGPALLTPAAFIFWQYSRGGGAMYALQWG